jgi:hypothetical protein
LSLVVVAALALACAGGMAWIVRQALADVRDQRVQLLAALERTLDRVESPGATVARQWQAPQAPLDALTREDEEWLASKESEVPWDDDLALADTEAEVG